MKDLSEAQESPFFTRKRIAVAIAILTVCGIALWMSLADRGHNQCEDNNEADNAGGNLIEG